MICVLIYISDNEVSPQLPNETANELTLLETPLLTDPPQAEGPRAKKCHRSRSSKHGRDDRKEAFIGKKKFEAVVAESKGQFTSFCYSFVY